MAKRIKMLIQITGLRNGKAWPAPGAVFALPDDEADSLVRAGSASYESAQPKPVETAAAPKQNIETAVPASKPVTKAAVAAKAKVSED